MVSTIAALRREMRWYGPRKQRRALLRALWHVARGHDGELCEACGRRYPLWRAADELYTAVIGSRGGLFCHGCFTAEAARRGIVLQWVPREFDTRRDM